MVSFYFTSYRNKDSFIPSLFVNALTGMKGWEEKWRRMKKRKGEERRGEGRRGQARRREEYRRREKRRLLCSTMRPVGSEKFGELLRHDVGTLCPTANLDC